MLEADEHGEERIRRMRDESRAGGDNADDPHGRRRSGGSSAGLPQDAGSTTSVIRQQYQAAIERQGR
jgi:hypothetical protein